MKKIVSLLVLGCILITMAILLTGCETKKSYTYDVETGDKIKITLKTTGGYNMTSDLPIEFSKDDDVISKGSFGKEELYDTYVEAIKDEDDAEIIEEKSNKTIEYVFYEYNNKEYNYIIKIKDSNTCFILGNKENKKSAQEIFNRISFDVEK